jgi:CTP synthase (UTP-ammonia lyase)
MNTTPKSGPGTPLIGIIGDKKDGGNFLQLATERALGHVPDPVPFQWIPTAELVSDPAARLAPFTGLLVSCSTEPYDSVPGALQGIRHARENRVPLFGACGGFQYLLLEFVRNVLGVADAEHAEDNPSAPRLALTPLSCSLVGQRQPVRLLKGFKVAGLCGADTVVEAFFCNYGLNPEFRDSLEANGLVVSALGDDGVVRAMELVYHPFYLGTLYVPQARSEAGNPHPVIVGLVEAARQRALALV